jgi:hypothetical protein
MADHTGYHALLSIRYTGTRYCRWYFHATAAPCLQRHVGTHASRCTQFQLYWASRPADRCAQCVGSIDHRHICCIMETSLATTSYPKLGTLLGAAVVRRDLESANIAPKPPKHQNFHTRYRTRYTQFMFIGVSLGQLARRPLGHLRPSALTAVLHTCPGTTTKTQVLAECLSAVKKCRSHCNSKRYTDVPRPVLPKHTAPMQKGGDIPNNHPTWPSPA